MIDLHTHTTYSDGSFTTKELLEEAENIGLQLLAITDHNTIEAHQEIKNSNIGGLFSGNLLTGVEITTSYKGETIEVLGYGFDLDSMQKLLDANVLSFEQKQLQEFELMKKRYREIGVIFDEKKILFNSKKESCRTPFVREIKSHPENIKFFLNQESIDSASGFTRNEVYNPKSPLHVDISSLFPSLERTIEMIHLSGGLAFLAHTYAYSPNIAAELETILDQFPLDGLECYYTTFTEEETNHLLEVCQRRNLYRSGGSDFHGTRKVNHNLGTGHGDLKIEDSIVKDWISNFIPENKKPKEKTNL